jgi:putative metallohydrolase (TIGR04338 family)
MPRDSQRSRVYLADGALYDFPQTDVSTQAKYLKRASEIFESKWMRDRYPSITANPPRIEFSPSKRGASAWAYTIRTGTSAVIMREYIILHELAHVIESRMPFDRKRQAHGWEFCEIYLSLVSRFMGAEAAARLKAAFKAHKARFTKPRTRTLTPEQRATMIERLAAARVKREPMPLAMRIQKSPRKYVTTPLKYGWARVWTEGSSFVAEHLAGNKQAPYAEGLFKFGDEAGLRQHLAVYGGAV